MASGKVLKNVVDIQIVYGDWGTKFGIAGNTGIAAYSYFSYPEIPEGYTAIVYGIETKGAPEVTPVNAFSTGWVVNTGTNYAEIQVRAFRICVKYV